MFERIPLLVILLYDFSQKRVILSNNKVGTYRLGQKEKIRLIKLEKKQLHVNS